MLYRLSETERVSKLEDAMRNAWFGPVALLTFAIASPCLAGLIGSPVSGSTSVTGSTTIDPLGSLGSTTVGAGTEFSFCVGPNADNCASSGLFGSVDISDNAVTFSFFGSTFPTDGSFDVMLSGFNPVIQSVTFISGALLGGSFGLTSFTSSSMTFTGSVGAGGVYDAVGGVDIIFDVASVPEPGSLFLGGLGILVGIIARRRRSARA
jgi:hypothetical protein